MAIQMLKSQEWINIVYLPPNTASIVQPIDQGIIQIHYSEQLIFGTLEGYVKVLMTTDDNSSIFDALLICAKSWRLVTRVTIRNSFHYSTLSKCVTEKKGKHVDLSLVKMD